MDLRVFTDQLNNKIQVAFPPQRIVSLVPSQTELLFDLGLEDEIIGVTKFCIHPDHFKTTKTIIGGTKQFHLELIDNLQPDLIIGNKEENYEDGIEQLRKKYPVWMSDIYTMSDAVSMIKSIGDLTNASAKAIEIIRRINDAFASLKKHREKKVLYLIWRKPWMAAGRNTFIGSILETLGLVNVLYNESRYPELTERVLVDLNPEVILLSSEPFPFKQTHMDELQKLVPNAKVILVDGEMFSWYGSRLMKAPEYLNALPIS